ncbi:hypothetical protein ABMC45_10675 [Comamonas kerstersii]
MASPWRINIGKYDGNTQPKRCVDKKSEGQIVIQIQFDEQHANADRDHHGHKGSDEPAWKVGVQYQKVWCLPCAGASRKKWHECGVYGRFFFEFLIQDIPHSCNG